MNRSRRRRGRAWAVFTTAFALLGLGLLILSLAPELQARHQWLAMAASFFPYGWFAWLAAGFITVASTRGRGRFLVLPLALGLAVHTVALFPYVPDPASAVASEESTLTVLALNLRFGQADLAALADEVERSAPDVVVLTEVTASSTATFSQRRWRKRLPYRAGTAGRDFADGAGDASGTLVLSRLPVVEVGRTDDTSFTNLAVRFELGGRRVVLVAAHPANPTHSLRGWLRDGQAVANLARAHTDGPLLVAGDLNATAEHLTLRTLIARTGLGDTASGQGWHPTYPANRWFPPLIGIDHVLASREFQTIGYRTVKVAGTDHLGLLVRLGLR